MSVLERTIDLKITEYICDNCGQGKMKYIGHFNQTHVHYEFEHMCNNCGYTSWLEKRYPYWEDLKVAMER